MTKTKSTKKSLLASMLSLLICVAMLVGSTFAWFTDSVTSGRNKITAGNLDIKVEYAKAGAADDGEINEDEWKTVKDSSEIFDDEALWEPGHTEYVYLRVRNVGNLALKYNFAVAAYGDAEGKPEEEYTSLAGGKTKLSKHLVANRVAGTEAVANRESLWLAAEAEKAALGNIGTVAFTETEPLKPGDSYDCTLAIYMPTSVGNEANWVGAEKAVGESAPSVCFGINVNATQVPSESDSFGKDYDKDAPLVAATPAELESLFDKINEEDDTTEKHVVLDGNMSLDENVTLNVAENKNVVLDIFGHDLEVENADRNGIFVSSGANVTITDSQSGGTLKLHSQIIYNLDAEGNPVDRKDGDALTGGIYAKGDGENKANLTIEDIKIEMVDEGGSTPIIAEDADVTLGEGADITTQAYGIWAKENATVTVDGANITVGSGVTQHAFVIGNPAGESSGKKGVVKFESGTVNAKHGVNGSVFELCTDGELEITGGTFNLDTDEIVEDYFPHYLAQYLIISNGGGKATIGGDAVINAYNTKAKTNTTGGRAAFVIVFSLGADVNETVPAYLEVTGNAKINLIGAEGYVYMGCAQHGSEITISEGATVHCTNELEVGVTYLGMVGTSGKIYVSKKAAIDQHLIDTATSKKDDPTDNNRWVIE